jgi:hypothetical protein
MEAPFVYGKVARRDDYTDREAEAARLVGNFTGLVNTVLISPRRWGKTSLVSRAADTVREKHGGTYTVCHFDAFSCRDEEQFYTEYANAVLRAGATAWETFAGRVKRYLGLFLPKLTVSDVSQNFEVSFGLDVKTPDAAIGDILNLPQKIAKDTGKKFIVCVDEFQNIGGYPDSAAFQKRLRSHWQRHDLVCYCLYGSKRHLLSDIFGNPANPFYKFGDVLFLQKIGREEWVDFIGRRFTETGKRIPPGLCGQIADAMRNHPYYVQQLSQLVWLRTKKVCDENVFREALAGLVDQLSLLFTNVTDMLSARQLAFLRAVAAGEKNFSSQAVLRRYGLGTSANVTAIKKALLEKDLIDILPERQIELQDPVFGLWLGRLP